MLNKQKGNMYGFVTHTWNTLLGRCLHGCMYCYNLGKPFFEGKLRFNEKNLKDNLGSGNYIFVGSSNDLFAANVPEEWIIKTMNHCKKYPQNKYLFQTKNTSVFYHYKEYAPNDSIIGTTIETNRETNKLSNAPHIEERAYFLGQLDSEKFKRMVTIEPIMDFDLNELVLIIRMCRPNFVNIGADSKGHNLPEPSPEKVEALIKELKKFTIVKIKSNLKRLRGG